MSRIVNPFDPFGFVSAGSLAAFQAGLELMQRWQQAMMPMLTLPVQSMAGFRMAAPWKFAGFIPQVDSRGAPVAAAQASSPVRPPEPAWRAPVEAVIARGELRPEAMPGCLRGVEVVYPPASEVKDAPPSERPVLDAVVNKARIAKPRAATPAKTTAKTTVKSAATGAKKAPTARRTTTRK